MKVSVKKKSHVGEQPVRVLKHNLTTRLVERNEEYIKSLQSDFRLEKYSISHWQRCGLLKFHFILNEI